MKLKLLLLALIALPWLTPISVSRAQQQRDLKLVNDVAQLPDRAKRFAVLIGVNDYDDEQIGALVGPANDMQMLEDALVANAGFDRNHIRRLTRDQAEASLKPTRFNVLRALSNALKAVPPDGLLVLAFSGHGTERNGRAFLLPADAQVNADIELLEASALEVAALKNMIRNRRSSPASPVTGVAQVVVLLDACRNDPTSGKDTSINPLTRAYDFSLRNSNVKAFVTLYATALGARAYESRARRQGYFISEVVAALRGEARDALNERGEVTLDRLIRHIQKEVPARVAFETGNDQKPWFDMIGFNALDLVLAKATPAVAVAPVVRPAPVTTPVNAPPPAPSVRMSLTGVPLTAMSFTTANVNAQGQKINERTAQCWGFVDTLPGGVALEMVELPPGEFMMGSNDGDSDEKPMHQVKLKGFAIGKYEVTQGQWKAVMGRLPSNMSDLSNNLKGDTLPVVSVSWYDAQDFITQLNIKLRLIDTTYHLAMRGDAIYQLPSEAEWEYAARANTTTPFAFGPTITSEIVNYGGGKTIPVGSLGVANAWGLFDMHGNVWEWCKDEWYNDYSGAPEDGRAWESSSYPRLAGGPARVDRGGGWGDSTVYCRSANRNNEAPDNSASYIGFRLVRK